MTSRVSFLACLACRQERLKCDALTPACGHCAQTGTECSYTKSQRRSKSSTRKRRARSNVPLEQPDELTVNIVDLPREQHLPCGSQSTESRASSVNLIGPEGKMAHATRPAFGSQTPGSSLARNESYLFSIYYAYFHPAHPILLPWQLFKQAQLPSYLKQVVEFVATHFTTGASGDTYRNTIVETVLKQAPAVEKVQALLLLSIALHSRTEHVESEICLAAAVDLALELGLHRATYAETASPNDSIRAECLRRTWWEVFVIEGLLVFFGKQRICRTALVPLEVPLPCEESTYQEGLTLPIPQTITQFDARIFSDEEREFSSYAYRIDAVRILNWTLTNREMVGCQQKLTEAVDARIASWFHHLPSAKAELLRPDGSVDEIMFQAVMIVNSASIHINFSHSDLLSSPAAISDVICSHQGSTGDTPFSSHTHAMKAIKAATELSSLAAISLPVEKHTPFLVCALALSCVVQLAACSDKAGQTLDATRDHIALSLGVLKSMGQNWALSQMIMHQVKAVARDVLDLGIGTPKDLFDFTTFLDMNGQFFMDGVIN
ncbi:uncharacterized protein N7498_000327 [Penicillium cinerascens]|uniref:Zn(2)-C6 fungal-type domain-containing protein n=1 Tax=Penicillium cinerascens TaxID=70096 RepID=A0A9W9NGM5_9EURO|nr:uncharacterized protein N7498_000327 [Penicillium cinerascens]KAJ5218228.1 hypothetical protein N7498_000327 [Penicillium cinerascens]